MISSKSIVTLQEVRAAWKVFNDLPIPLFGSAPAYFRAREVAWGKYVKVRDLYLYESGALRLPQMTRDITVNH